MACNSGLKVKTSGTLGIPCQNGSTSEECLEDQFVEKTVAPDEFFIELSQDFSVSNQPDIVFNWKVITAQDNPELMYTFVVASDAGCENQVFEFDDLSDTKKNVQFIQDGTYYLCVYARKGSAGTKVPAQNNGFKFIVDQHAPTITAPQTTVVKNSPFQLDVQASDANEMFYSWKQILGPGQAAFSDSHALNPDISFDQDGNYILQLVTKDVANNSAEQLFNVTWTSVVPVATITGTPTSLTNQTTFTATIGGTGVTRYKFKITNAANCSDATTYNADVPVSQMINADAVSLGDGQVRLCVLGRNAAGLWQTTATEALWVVDTTGPMVAVSSFPTYVNIGNQSAVPISGSCSENGRNVVVGGAVTATIVCASNAWSTNLNMNSLADGSQRRRLIKKKLRRSRLFTKKRLMRGAKGILKPMQRRLLWMPIMSPSKAL